MFCNSYLSSLSTYEGWCCTIASATIQRTALVPGWALNTCLEKLWKLHVTNGTYLYRTLYFPIDGIPV